MQINPQNNTAINSYYTITTNQITDFQSYLNDNYYTGGFTDNQILKAVANYLAITPSKQTALYSNYTITTSQITDLISTLQNFLVKSPTTSSVLNANYQLTNQNFTNGTIAGMVLQLNSITGQQLLNNIITAKQIANGTIQISNLDSSLAPIFYSLYSCSQQEAAVTTNYGQTKSYQTYTPLDFYHYNKITSDGTLMSNNQTYIGGSYYQFKTTNSIVLTSSSSYINFDTSKLIYGAGQGNQGARGMFSALGPYNTLIGSTALGVNLTGNSSYSYPITFSLNNTNNSLISQINNTGAYTANSDENLKHNLTEKQNHQEQLDKLLKLKLQHILMVKNMNKILMIIKNNYKIVVFKMKKNKQFNKKQKIYKQYKQNVFQVLLIKILIKMVLNMFYLISKQ